MEPRVEVSRYTVSVMPEGSNPRNRYHLDLTVEHIRDDMWAVRNSIGQSLGPDGTWSLDHRSYDLDTALQLAKEAAPKVDLASGMTPAQCIEWEVSRRGA